jgi:DNA-binding CsgD family transcriptional regulator
MQTPGPDAHHFDLPNLTRVLDFFFNSVTVSPLVITITNYTDGSCAYVSPTFKDVTGYDADQLKNGGMNWLVNKLHVEDRSGFKINFTEGFLFLLKLPTEQKLRCFFNLTARLIHKNGEAISIYHQCRPLALDQEGKPQYSINLITDITQLLPDGGLQPCWSVVERADEMETSYLGGSCNDSLQWLFGMVSSPLSTRERDVMKELMKGKSGKQASQKLGITVNTLNTHRKNIIRKARAANIQQAIDIAIKNDWIGE